MAAKDWRTGTAALLLLVACGEAEPIFAPGDSRAKATIVLTVTGRGVTAVAHTGDADGMVQLDLDAEDRELWVLHYERTLAELRIEEGLIPPAAPDEASRPLPVFVIGRRALVEEGQSIGFEEVGELSGRAADFRILALDTIGCAEAGGCLVSGSCELPCPAATNLPDVVPPTAPMEAEPPVLTPCPTGWAEVTLGGATVCEPPVRVETSCAAGSAQWIDTATCAPIIACPTGEWPDPLPPNARWFVRPGDAGDGTVNAPFGSIDDALAAATTGDVVVLARGRHAAGTFDVDASFVGACPADTLIAGDITVPSETMIEGASIEGSIAIEPSAALTLRGVVVDGDIVAEGPVVLESVRVDGHLNVVDGATATVTRAVFQQTLDFGVRVNGADATLTDVVILDVELTDGTDGRGDGMRVISGNMVAQRILIQRASYTGISSTRSMVGITDLFVRDTRPREDGASGQGIEVRRTSTVALSRATFLENRTFGVYVQHEAHLTLSDVVVANTHSRTSDGGDGQGLYVRDDAEVLGERLWFSANRGTGIVIRGGAVSLSDVTVRETIGNEATGRFGEGIYVGGASLELERATVVDNNEAGVVIAGGAQLVAEDLTIRGTRTSINGDLGYGLTVVGEGSQADVAAALVSSNRRYGVRVIDGAILRASDLTVTDTTRDDIADEASAAIFIGASDVELQRVRFADNEDRGLRARDDSVIDVRDVLIADNGGYGVLISDGAVFSGDRMQVEGSGQANLVAGIDGHVDLSNVLLANCRTVRTGFAAGMVVEPTGDAGLTHFVISDNEGTGVLHRSQGRVRLADGIVRNHPVGLLLGEAVDGPNISLVNVRFESNDVTISVP